MASEQKHGNGQKVTAKAVAAFVLIAALSGLRQPAAPPCLPFGSAAERESLHVVLTVMTGMWQVVEAYFLDSQSSAYCLIHLLVAGGHLVRTVLGAA